MLRGLRFGNGGPRKIESWNKQWNWKKHVKSCRWHNKSLPGGRQVMTTKSHCLVWPRLSESVGGLTEPIHATSGYVFWTLIVEPVFLFCSCANWRIDWILGDHGATLVRSNLKNLFTEQTFMSTEKTVLFLRALMSSPTDVLWVVGAAHGCNLKPCDSLDFVNIGFLDFGLTDMKPPMM